MPQLAHEVVISKKCVTGECIKGSVRNAEEVRGGSLGHGTPARCLTRPDDATRQLHESLKWYRNCLEDTLAVVVGTIRPSLYITLLLIGHNMRVDSTPLRVVKVF